MDSIGNFFELMRKLVLVFLATASLTAYLLMIFALSLFALAGKLTLSIAIILGGSAIVMLTVLGFIIQKSGFLEFTKRNNWFRGNGT